MGTMEFNSAQSTVSYVDVFSRKSYIWLTPCAFWHQGLRWMNEYSRFYVAKGSDLLNQLYTEITN